MGAAEPVERSAELVVLSGHTPTALDAQVTRLCEWLGDRPGTPLGDLAHSLATTRVHHPHRAAFVAGSVKELRLALEQGARPSEPDGQGKLAMLFTGERQFRH